jgi:ABC-type uncharacterized transport system permease subunit
LIRVWSNLSKKMSKNMIISGIGLTIVALGVVLGPAILNAGSPLPETGTAAPKPNTGSMWKKLDQGIKEKKKDT